MSLVPVSDALKDLLDRKGMRGQTVGAVEACGMKGAGVSYGSDGPQVAAAASRETTEEVRSGVRLVWTNPTATRKSATKRAPLLVVV